MIEPKEISVVISGPVFTNIFEETGRTYTQEACMSVRELLPGAEIVLSTWKGTNCEGLSYDVLVLNDDPGPNEGNINRQITSRKGGIQAATRKYVLAIRSESRLINTNFLAYLDQFDLYDEKYRFVQHRVVIPATCPPRRPGGVFHMGDWYFFGHKEDIWSLWDLPLMDDSQYNRTKDDLLYNPHRWLITSFVRKHMPLQFYKKEDYTQENQRLYEAILANNFIVTGFIEFGLRSMKHLLDTSFFGKMEQYSFSYTHTEWKMLYNEYCGGSLQCQHTLRDRFGIYVYCPVYNTKNYIWAIAVSGKERLQKIFHVEQG